MSKNSTSVLGISFASEAELRNRWCFQEEPWIYDAEMEQRVKEQFPFLLQVKDLGRFSQVHYVVQPLRLRPFLERHIHSALQLL